MQVMTHPSPNLSERNVVSLILLVLAGWSALSVVSGLLLCRSMRHPSQHPAPPAVLPWDASTASSPATVGAPGLDAPPNRTAASA
jgi:hypothetical protein